MAFLRSLLYRDYVYPDLLNSLQIYTLMMICTNNVIHFYSRCLLIFFVVFPVNSCFSVFLVCQKVVMSRCMSFLVLRALFLHILCIRLDFNQLFNKNSRILQNSFKNIWSISQKCIPLHPLSGTKY